MTTPKRPHQSPGVLTLTLALSLAAPLAAQATSSATVRLRPEVPDIGSRLELFVDRFLVDRLEGARLRLHEPRREGVAVRFDRPWEGDFSGYVTVLHDGERYRMYYRGLPRSGADGSPAESTCYAESRDGVEWTRPELDLFEVGGHRRNNVILAGHAPASHNFSPFLDRNPDAPAEARFKALGGSRKGLLPFVSADGVRWRPLRDHPVITEGAFDSQNVSFWSEAEGCYLCYFRTWDGKRTISRTTSTDFVKWTKPVPMSYGDTPREHLYTNQTHPYFRAPHIYLGVAARFMPGRRVLTAEQADAIRVHPRYAGDCSDAVLLTSRGGSRYDRTFMEAFVRPGRGHENWVSRTNYPALGIVPTGDRLSIYVQKNYGQPTARLDRYTIRPDGFASVYGPYAGGEMVTRPFRFAKLSAAQIAARLAQPGRPAPPVSISTTAPIAGTASAIFTAPATASLTGTRDLGTAMTLAVTVQDVPAGHRRLFSSYDGGSTRRGELILDVNSGGPIDEGESIRFLYDGGRFGAPFAKVGDWSRDGKPHHVAVTWSGGAVVLYFDGERVGQGSLLGAGPIRQRLGDLRFGEDYPPTSRRNEPFLGKADDITVLRRALDDAQVRKLARHALGLEQDAAPELGPQDLRYTFEPDTPRLKFVPATGAEPAAQELVLNFATSAAGSVRVEIQDDRGQAIPGFTLQQCVPVIGDEIERAVRWRDGSDVSGLGGRPVRLRFVLRDADLFALRFR